MSLSLCSISHFLVELPSPTSVISLIDGTAREEFYKNAGTWDFSLLTHRCPKKASTCVS